MGAGVALLGAFIMVGCSVVIPAPRDDYVDGRLRVTYWEKWTDYEGMAVQKVVDRFNAIQDQYFVDVVTMSQIDQKALVAIAGGNPPDILGLWSFGLPQFAEKRALMPLRPFLEKAGMDLQNFTPVFLDMNTYDGELYGLPTTPGSMALHWNKKLFREAGLDPDQPPRTLAELDEMAWKLTKFDANGHITQLGFTPSEPGWWPWAWGFWFGGNLWDGERITYDSPENLAAYRWIESYVKRYGAEELRRFQSGVANQFNTPQNPFFSGRIAMVMQGVWMASFIDKFAPDLEWGAAPFPSAIPGLEKVTIAECDCITIPVGARHPEAAFAFIQYLCSQEGYEMLNLHQKKFTPLKTASEEFVRNHPNPYITLFMDLAASPNAHYTPDLPIWMEYMDETQAAFDRVMFGNQTPEQAVGYVQGRVGAMWDRAKAGMLRRKAAEDPTR